MSRGPIVVATRNAGKLRELAPLFRAAGLDAVDLAAAGSPAARDDEAGVEAYATFAENALAKARYFHRALGLACVADDSGLEVVALGGRPGVRSRRWAEDEGAAGDETAANNACLVRAMRGVVDRRARFVCAAAYCDDARELCVTGVVDGEITGEPRGRAGFGYDPYFFVPALAKTLAEASLDEKQRVSHRAAAVRALIAQIRRGN